MNQLFKQIDLESQLKFIFPLLLMVYVPAIVLLALMTFFAQWMGIEISNLTRDTVSVLCDMTSGETCPPSYTGVLSNLGILFWTASATISIFTAGVLMIPPTQAQEPHTRNAIFFLLAMGLLSALLLFDDLLLLHEKVYPKVGLPEKLAFGLYGLLFLITLIRFRTFFLKTDFLLLAIGFGFMALSIVVDTFPEDWSSFHHLFEDGFKFLGVVGWCTYLTTVSAKQLRAAPHKRTV